MATKQIITIRLKELRAEREKRLNEGLQSGRLVVRFNRNGRLVVMPTESRSLREGEVDGSRDAADAQGIDYFGLLRPGLLHGE